MLKRGKRGAVAGFWVIAGLIFAVIIVGLAVYFYIKLYALLPTTEDAAAIANFDKLKDSVNELLREEEFLYSYRKIELLQIPGTPESYVIAGFSAIRDNVSGPTISGVFNKGFNIQKPCAQACLCLYRRKDFENKNPPLKCENFPYDVEFLTIRQIEYNPQSTFVRGAGRYTAIYQDGLFPAFDEYDTDNACGRDPYQCVYSDLVLYGDTDRSGEYYRIGPVFVEKIRNSIYTDPEDRIFFLVVPYTEKFTTGGDSKTKKRLKNLDNLFLDANQLANSVNNRQAFALTDAEVLMYAEYMMDLKGKQDIQTSTYYGAITQIGKLCQKHQDKRVFREHCSKLTRKIGRDDEKIAALLEGISLSEFYINEYNNIIIGTVLESNIPKLISAFEEVHKMKETLDNIYMIAKLYLSYDPKTNLEEYKKGIEHLKFLLDANEEFTVYVSNTNGYIKHEVFDKGIEYVEKFTSSPNFPSYLKMEAVEYSENVLSTEVQKLQIMYDIAEAYYKITKVNSSAENMQNAEAAHKEFLDEFEKDKQLNSLKGFTNLYNLAQNRMIELCKTHSGNLCSGYDLPIKFDPLIDIQQVATGTRPISDCNCSATYGCPLGKYLDQYGLLPCAACEFERCRIPSQIVEAIYRLDNHIVIVPSKSEFEQNGDSVVCGYEKTVYRHFMTMRLSESERSNCGYGFCLNTIPSYPYADAGCIYYNDIK
jgi:hypothetical protein